MEEVVTRVKKRKLTLKRPIGRPRVEKKVEVVPKKRGRPRKDPTAKKRGRPPKKKYYNWTKTRNKKPAYKSSRDYDFLQYIRVVMHWAVEYSGLKKSEVELLLYLYPKGTFSKTDFCNYHRLIGMYQFLTLNRMMADGWVYKWRDAKPRMKQTALYALTNKSKIMCSKMHQFCVGEKDFPLNTKTNPILKSKERIDGYYLGYLKQMNKERARRLEEQSQEQEQEEGTE